MTYPQDGSLSADEKLWGMLAHLLTLLGYVVVVGAYIAPLVIYLDYKDRSQYVAFHALQALIFQQLALAVAIALVLFSIVTLGLGVLLAVPLAIAVLVYTIIAAIQANNGVWYELPIVGRWARNTLQLCTTPSPSSSPNAPHGCGRGGAVMGCRRSCSTASRRRSTTPCSTRPTPTACWSTATAGSNRWARR